MRTLIVYDSVHGNTRSIAQAISDAIPGKVKVLRASQVNDSELKTVDLLIVGAPTHGGGPSDAVKSFLDTAPADAFEGMNVAAFDTRTASIWRCGNSSKCSKCVALCPYGDDK